MKYLVPIALYLGFFGMIAFAVWLTNSGWPLWALLFAPSWKDNDCDCKKK